MSFNPIIAALAEAGKEVLVVDKEQVILNIAKICLRLFRPDLDKTFDELHPFSQDAWKDKAEWIYAEVKKST